MNAIFTRRSIRSFQNRPIEKEKMDRIIRAAMQAPSAMNQQAWEFLVITDEKGRAAVSGMSPYAKMAQNAAALIVPMMNRDLFRTNEALAAQDMAAATQNILLQTAEEGLGAVWMGWYPDERKMQAMRDAFQIPKTVLPFSVIALGYSDEQNRFVDRYRPDRVHFEKY